MVSTASCLDVEGRLLNWKLLSQDLPHVFHADPVGLLSFVIFKTPSRQDCGV